MTTPVNADMVEFDWDDVAGALFQAQGIKQGSWRLAVKINFAALTGQFQVAPDGPLVGLPTGMVGIAGLALMPATEAGPMVFDAGKPTKRRPMMGQPASPRQAAGFGKKPSVWGVRPAPATSEKQAVPAKKPSGDRKKPLAG